MAMAVAGFGNSRRCPCRLCRSRVAARVDVTAAVTAVARRGAVGKEAESTAMAAAG